MGTILGRLGYTFEDEGNTRVLNFSANAVAALNTVPDLLSDWQFEDLKEANVGGYYKNPMVYVDGRSNVAKAIIDSNGLITGIEVIDKTKTFECTPRVEIFGGNGLGAKAIAVMECRDEPSFVLFQTELAPSGVDSVIDCP